MQQISADRASTVGAHFGNANTSCDCLIRRQGMLSLSVVPQHQDFSPGHKPSWPGLFIGDQRGAQGGQRSKTRMPWRNV